MKRMGALLLVLITIALAGTILHGSGLGTHGVVGGALGAWLARNPLEAFAVGFLSHALLDVMPHHDPVEEDPLDVGFFVAFNLGALFVAHETYRAHDDDQRILWGAIGGMLPDLEHLLFYEQCEGFELCSAKLYPTHNNRLPHHGDAPFLFGYALETAVSLLVIRIAF